MLERSIADEVDAAIAAGSAEKHLDTLRQVTDLFLRSADGYTGEQRFFMGWSQAWREKARDERKLQLLTIDPHSPPEFRANGAAVNHDGFHEAFKTKPGDKMFKPSDDRIRIW